ncbi:hypothetical protein WMY93_020111 [Mugilogobius chulae]|uniref:Uncharacterized protein n=1 Tax=Mugilogobius chulae TaxID=88201 RepID=A0AAW0NHH2_9GOBI
MIRRISTSVTVEQVGFLSLSCHKDRRGEDNAATARRLKRATRSCTSSVSDDNDDSIAEREGKVGMQREVFTRAYGNGSVWNVFNAAARCQFELRLWEMSKCEREREREREREERERERK